MKKYGLLAIALLVGTSGCLRKKTSTVTETLQTQGTQQPSTPQKQLFMDDVDAFVLEEEQDPFSASQGFGDAVQLGEPSADWKQEQSAQFSFKTIYFDFDTDTMRGDQKNALEFNLSKIKEATAAGHMVVIEGHACKFAGSAVYNMMLSEKRAQAVARYFKQHGIAADKIKVVGRGNEMCIISDGDKEAQAPNRRVEIYILN